MTIPQIDGVDTNAVNYINEPTFICLTLMTIIAVIWAVLVIYARLPKDDNEVNLIEMLVDNYGETIHRIVFTVIILLSALAAYFNYCY